ncbi:MAG TPA: cytidine deaminase [Chthoniobacterales bacterium]|nr:cytidine deaminase [Chthoniobacterales bacterium]
MVDSELIDAAAKARAMAYAPYSKFTVGAAVLTKQGKVFVGCNVENLSLGLTICAERSAVAAAIAQGSKDLAAIAIVTGSKKPAAPCGACRQVLAEFNPTMRVLAATVDGASQRFELSELLPVPTQGILETAKNV